MRNRTFYTKFGKDIMLNPFGDYDRLVLCATEENGVITKEWSLMSFAGASTKRLNDDEVRKALEIIFIHSASAYDGIPALIMDDKSK